MAIRIGPDDLQTSLFDEGPPAACPPRFNMAAYVLDKCSTSPEKTALEVISDVGTIAEAWSFAALKRAILGTATGLQRMGIKRGDRIVLRVGNTSDFPILFFAANAIGAVPVPTSTLLTARELAYIVDDCAPKLICDSTLETPQFANALTESQYKPMRDLPVASFADTSKDDAAYMVYTSGTSGKPKGVLHAQRAAWARRMMWDGWYGLRESDRVLHAGAFNWTYTLGVGLTDPWAIGATALIYTGPPDKSIWAGLAARHKASIFAAAPGVFRQLLASNADCETGFAHLRHALCAGEKLPDSTREHWQKATGKPVYEALGMSEVSTYISQSPTHPNAGSRPQTGRRIAILDDTNTNPVPCRETGNLAVHKDDQGLMLRYWNAILPLKSNTWFVTGDRASMDENGDITFQGRLDDMLNAQGYRVSAQEIEDVLSAHPDIAECAVVELPVRDGLSIIAAYFTALTPNVTVSNLETYCATNLARYKCPKAFTQLSELPKSANGKLLRRDLIKTHGWNPE